jgi:outer membrane protein insertion porin family
MGFSCHQARAALWLVLLTSVLTPVPFASAQAPVSVEALEGSVVRDLQFEGLRRVESAAVRVVLTTREGQPFRIEAVAEDVRAIFGMGFFEDVEVYADRADSGGVVVTYRLVEKPAVRKTRVEGNSSVSTEDIEEVLDIRPFTIFDESRIRRNVRKIKDLYNEKGYYLADISYRVEPSAESEVVVVFVVNESAKVQVRSIEFVGNEAFDDATLRSGIETREGGLLSFIDKSGTYKKDAFQVDILRITSRYFDHGYINVQVDPPDIEISPDRKYIYITIRITEGEQFFVGDLDFSGDLIVPKDELFGRLGLEKGDVFSRSKLSQDLLQLKTRYEDEGYAYANITPLTSVDPESRIINVTFDIQKGNLVYYERINVVGNTKTRDKVIRRELRIYEGELTSASKRELSRRRVNQLGFFETVEVRTRRGSSDRLQVVDVEVKERATGTFQVGAGFSSVENFIFTAQIAQQNFLGRGQSLQLSASISSIRQLFNLRFVEPYFLDTRWLLSVSAFNTELRFTNFNRAARGGEVLFGHPITFISENLQISAGYRLEFVDSSDVFGTTTPLFQPLNNSGRVSQLRGILTFDTRDNRLFPTRGMFHSASVDVSAKWLGATDNRSFQRLRLFMRFYYPIVWKFIGRLQLRMGWLNPTSDRQFAPSENFIIGGIQTLRGYAPLSVGPERQAVPNPSGSDDVDPFAEDFVFVEGGNKEFIMNAEIEFPLVESIGIRGVVFVDAGNVFGQDENFFYLNGAVRPNQRGADDRFEFEYEDLPLGLLWSAGFGFRWFSPIGPLRFEWGFPLTRRPRDVQSPLFEFSIGNSF